MNYNPRITIITSTFNAEKDIERAIKSVVAQSYKNIQFVIIDGGSTDRTIEIVKKYDNYVSVLISEKDNGIYDAWNKGLVVAEGSWIAYLGADDEYLPDAILNYVNHINKFVDVDVDYVSSKVGLIDSSGKLFRVIGKAWDWKVFKKYMCTAHVGSFHSKAFFDKYGNFNTDYKIVGDYEILLRANRNLKASFLDAITVNMQMGGVSNQNRYAFDEVMKAKICLGARTNLEANYDNIVANVIYFLRKLI